MPLAVPAQTAFERFGLTAGLAACTLPLDARTLLSAVMFQVEFA